MLFVQGDLVAVSVLSGNRNFEGRVNPMTRANYLASPLLVVAYALAGTVLIDFHHEPIGLMMFCCCFMKIHIYVFKTFYISSAALDQWCLRKLLRIKWYHHVWNDDVRWKTEQPHLSATVQARRLSLFSHIARMPDESDAKQVLTASPLENWRRPPGHPRTTYPAGSRIIEPLPE